MILIEYRVTKDGCGKIQLLWRQLHGPGRQRGVGFWVGDAGQDNDKVTNEWRGREAKTPTDAVVEGYDVVLVAKRALIAYRPAAGWFFSLSFSF